MHEEEIRLVLDQACNNPEIYFQISQQPPYLYIFINRQTKKPLDYEALTAILAETIADLDFPQIDYLALYSRPWGEVDTDWQTCVAIEDFVRETMVVSSEEIEAEKARLLQQKPTPRPTSLEEEATEVVSNLANQPIVDDLTAVVGRQWSDPPSDQITPVTDHSPDLNSEDFSSYCFIRDRVLLEANLREIPPKVAKSIAVFHRFPTRGKHRVLPLLGQIFEGDRGIVFIHFPDQVQQWFEAVLTLDADEIELARLWFSRYCLNITKTLKEIQYLMRVVSEQDTYVPASVQTAQTNATNAEGAKPTSPRLVLDARPREVAATPDRPKNDRSEASSKSGIFVSAPSTASPAEVSSAPPKWLWVGFILLGIGALFLGSIAGFTYGRGGNVLMWISLFLAFGLESFSAATANMALRQLEGGLFTVCWIINLILPLSGGLIGGYLAGWLLGLGVGNILRFQFVNTHQPLPTDFSGLIGLFQTREGTIALATALVGFSIGIAR